MEKPSSLPTSQRTGEMGRRIAEIDWKSTPLGDSASWPKSFQSTVALILGSRYPMILLWGSELFQFYNDAYIGLIGAKHPDALGRSIRETQAESWNAIGPMIQEVMTTGTPNWVPAQQLPLRRSGYLEESYFSLSYSAVDDDNGVIGGMLCVCSEVTEQVLNARRMKLLRELYTAAEHRDPHKTCEQLARVLTEYALDIPFAALYLRSKEGDALELCGKANLPQSTLFPQYVSLEIPTDVGLPFARCMKGERTTVDDIERHLEFRGGPFGDPVKTAFMFPITSGEAAEPLGVVVAAVSPARALSESYRTFYELFAGKVSSLVRNAHAFEQERKRSEALAEIDKAKTTFFSNVSHEFRTPLTLILGPVEDALSTASRSLDGDKLEAVYRNTLRLLRLVNSLLDFSRMEDGRMEARFEETDLAMLTAGLAGSFQSLLTSAGLKFVIECPQTQLTAYVDRTHWEKIVLNLISNAFKFTFEGEIAVRLKSHAGIIELSVSDTGTGIPQSELLKIFERFYRVEGAKSRSYEGTGIGLALVQQLVNHHKGTVRVESTVDKGSTFIVTIRTGNAHLPPANVVTSEQIVVSRKTPTPFPVEAAHWGGGMKPLTRTTPPQGAKAAVLPIAMAQKARILIADDNADMREYLTRLLETKWELEVVEDGQAALEAALRKPPDLILSDVMMPKMDGVTLVRTLRANPKTSIVPFILLSARAGEDAIIGGLETGADDYLVKPFSARELLGRVGSHLEMARMRRAAIDASHELAETRAGLLAALERKNKELEAFSYSVSHDLRAPLRSIDGFSQALIEDFSGVLGPEGCSQLNRVRNAAQRMGELIDDLLKLSQVERADLRCEPVDLSRIARRISEHLKKSAPNRNLQFVIDDGLIVNADARLIEILLENLLTNAAKFTSRVADPKIEVKAEQIDGERTFLVRDNGAGFDSSYAGRLFTAFQRLHSEAEFPGTGIGLATVKRIAERHGGKAWATGKVGQGATLFFTLSGELRKSGA